MPAVIVAPRQPQPSFLPSVPRRFPTAMLDRAHDMIRGCMDMQMHFVFALDRRIDEERLARAMQLLLLAEPLLACRWVPGVWRPAWQRRSDLDQIPLCTLEVVDAKAVDDAILRYLTETRNPEIDPVIHVRIVRAAVDTLCIKLDHTVCDAYGMTQCTYTLAAIYTTLGDNPRYLPQPNLAGSRSYGQLVEQLSVGDRLRMLRRWWRDQQSLKQPEGWWALPTRPGFQKHPMSGKTYVIKRIPQERIRAARDLSKSLGVSLNDIWVAAHLKALWEVIQPPSHWPLRIELMVDLRRHLRKTTNAALCNLSGRCLLTIAGGGGMSLEALALRVRDQMRLLKEDLIGTGSWLFTPLLANTLPHAWARAMVEREHLGEDVSSQLLTPLFSNAGRLDAEQLRFGEVHPVDVFGIGAFVKPPFFTTALMALGESMTLATGFYESGFERSLVVDLYDRMVDAISGTPGRSA